MISRRFSGFPTPNAERKVRNSPMGGEQRLHENAFSTSIFGRQQRRRTGTKNDSLNRRLENSSASKTPVPRKLRRLENSGASKTLAPRKLRRLENSGASKTPAPRKLRRLKTLTNALGTPTYMGEPANPINATNPSLDGFREAAKHDELSAEATLLRQNCRLPPAISGQSVSIYPHLAFRPAVLSPPASGRKGIDPHLALSQP